MHKNLLILLTALITSFTISCAKVETENEDTSDLNGVWKIELTPTGNSAAISYRNVVISEKESKVEISNCKSSEDMQLIRDEEYLVNNLGGSLRVVTSKLIESASIPNVILLQKTQKSDFFNAGAVEISSDTFGDYSTDTNVCIQRIVTDEDEPNYYHFHLSFPFQKTVMEMDIEYLKNENSSFRNIQSFKITSPIFIDSLRSRVAIATRGELVLQSISDDAAHFTFNLTSLNNPANINNSLPGPTMSGSFKVTY